MSHQDTSKWKKMRFSMLASPKSDKKQNKRTPLEKKSDFAI